MHKEDIKAALRKKFGSLRRFELMSNIPIDSTKDVLRGRAIAQTEKAIATALGKSLHVLFPGRYEIPEDGESSTKVDSISPVDNLHRLSRGAA